MQVKDKYLKTATGDADLMKLFNQMIGNDEPDPTIVIPKYERIYTGCNGILQMLNAFCSSPVATVFGSVYPNDFTMLRGFVKTGEELMGPLKLETEDKVYSGAELNAANADPAKLAQLMTSSKQTHKIANLGERYKTLKTCPVAQNVVMLARNIKTALGLEKERRKQAKHDLEVKAELRDGFIVNTDGDTLELFPFCKLNFKAMMLSDRMDVKMRGYTLTVLHLMYNRCIAVVQDLTSPDMDVDKFSELMVNSIGELKKHIPRCDQAFAKIQNSVDLMKNNFGGYYKDFISSQNPTIIAEHFLSDVARDTEADPSTTRQFRQIAAFYAKHVNNSGVKDPRIKKMMAMLGSNLDILDGDKKKEDTKETKETTEPKEPKSEKPAPPAAATPPADADVLAANELKPVLKGKKKAAAKKTNS
jgi:hypothetical protein